MTATLFELDELPAAAVECPKCGCVTGHKLHAIHEGQSTRLDCGWCGRTLDFPTWYGVRSDQLSAVSDQPGESKGAA